MEYWNDMERGNFYFKQKNHNREVTSKLNEINLYIARILLNPMALWNFSSASPPWYKLAIQRGLRGKLAWERDSANAKRLLLTFSVQHFRDIQMLFCDFKGIVEVTGWIVLLRKILTCKLWDAHYMKLITRDEFLIVWLGRWFSNPLYSIKIKHWLEPRSNYIQCFL